MPRNKLALYVHLVWATWDRQALLTAETERVVLRSVSHEAAQCGCKVIAADGANDHMHLLVAMPTTITIADLVKQLKGISSRLVNERFQLPSKFRWQRCYGAFTISQWDVPRVVRYVRQQKQHHETSRLMPRLEHTEEPDPPVDVDTE